MAETITIQLGQCGSNLGETFWENLCQEHCINPDGCFYGQNHHFCDRIHTYFRQVQDHFIPRTIFADLDKATEDKLQTSSVVKLFNPSNLIFSNNGADNNFAKGYLSDGIMDEILNAIRKEMEMCDRLQGLNVIAAIGGGTGSGLGTLLLENLSVNYPKKLLTTFTIIPSKHISETVIEPYNAIHSMPALINNCHQCFCYENDAIYEICKRDNVQTIENFDYINSLIAESIADITTADRFSTVTPTNLHKIYTNLVPYSDLHFIVPGIQATIENNLFKTRQGRITKILQLEIFNKENLLTNCDPLKGKYLGVNCFINGVISPQIVDDVSSRMIEENPENFIFNSMGISSSINLLNKKGLEYSSSFVGNTTAIGSYFNDLRKQFNKLFKKRAFLHWYTSEGMEEADFKKSAYTTRKLIEDYYQTAVIEEEKGEEEE